MAQTTKEAIAASLKRLLEQKPLDKITVTDIAEDCHISRHTFYYHFRDVYDLMEWIYRSQEAELQESGKADWRQGMVELFHRLQEDRTVVESTLRSGSRDCLLPSLCQRTHALSQALVEEACGSMSPSRRECLACFYKHALAGVVLDWAESGMRRDPAEILSDLDVALPAPPLNGDK